MDYRYERKFYIENKTLPQVEAIVKLHPYGFSEIYAPRQINNIYLDFYNLQNFFDNVDGLHLRKKHRIRWYGETFEDIKKPVLEIKMKNGLLGSKANYKVNPFELGPSFTKATLNEIFDNTEVEKDDLRQELKTMKPALLNCYKRKYFMSANKQFRITIDWSLKYYKILEMNNTFNHKLFMDNNVILELKYAHDMDDDVDQISNRFPFRVTKSSKYVEGIESLYGVL